MPNWTDEQLAAMEETDGSLLVSAAAGSGKTAVLVERVLRRLTDAVAAALDNGADIDDDTVDRQRRCTVVFHDLPVEQHWWCWR